MEYRDNLVEGKRGKRLLKSAVKIIAIISVISGVFWAGIGVGNGNIVLGRDAVFHKSIQKTVPANLDYSSVEQVYDALRRGYDGQLDVNKLLDGLKAGLAQATNDPYTEYFNADDAKKLEEQLTGSFTGIGAELGKDQDKNLIVISPIAGFPADKAGLKAKDIIVEVDGTSTANMTISQAVNHIRGPKDTKVTLKLVRAGSQQLSLTITRAEITVPSVKSEILSGNIGYLQITQFSKDTAQLATDAANKFKQAGVKGIIVDLRGDPGGYLDSAVDISGLWLDSGKTVLTERRDGTIVQTYTTRGTPVLQGIPTVVLIDEGSASAAEIMAGALRDNNVATLIGVTSFGKGSVQQVVELPGGAELKVTIARWYTPAGKNIDKQGIVPDQEVKRTEDDFKAGRDPQKDAAILFLKK